MRKTIQVRFIFITERCLSTKNCGLIGFVHNFLWTNRTPFCLPAFARASLESSCAPGRRPDPTGYGASLDPLRRGACRHPDQPGTAAPGTNPAQPSGALPAPRTLARATRRRDPLGARQVHGPLEVEDKGCRCHRNLRVSLRFPALVAGSSRFRLSFARYDEFNQIRHL
jgi:hypothetical protein